MVHKLFFNSKTQRYTLHEYTQEGTMNNVPHPQKYKSHDAGKKYRLEELKKKLGIEN